MTTPLDRAAQKVKLAAELIAGADAELAKASHMVGADFNLVHNVRAEGGKVHHDIEHYGLFIRDLRRKGWKNK